METVCQALCSGDHAACTQFTYLAMHKLSGDFHCVIVFQILFASLDRASLEILFVYKLPYG